jgi:periplasmic protein TonB
MMRRSKAVVGAVAVAFAGMAGAAEPAGAQSVHTWALALDAEGRVAAVTPYGGAHDASARALQDDIRGWVFAAGDAAGAPSLTYLRVVVEPGLDGAAEVVSATTGPAPERLSQPEFPVRDQLAGREGMVVLELDVGADGRVAGAGVHATSGRVSRAMADAAVAAAGDWTFATERVGDRAVASRLLWPVCYLGPASSPSACSWVGPDAQRFSSKTVLPLDPNVRLVSQAD